MSKCCNVHRTVEGLLLLGIAITVSVSAFQPVDAGVEVLKGLLLMHAHLFPASVGPRSSSQPRLPFGFAGRGGQQS